jgi:hypothetical protein
MLRFRPNVDEPAARLSGGKVADNRLRWRLWILVIALGLVVATMRRLDQPSTTVRLEEIFGTTEMVLQPDTDRPFVLGMDETLQKEPDVANPDDTKPDDPDSEDPDPDVRDPAKLSKSEAPSTDRQDLRDALDQVQDNTYFRPAEHEAWFALLGRLQQMNSLQVAENSWGELSYAQLLKQPDVYRGRIVTLSGTLRREEVEQAAANTMGVADYHRLVIQPRGGGHWPLIAYCLDLPAELPRGDDLNSPVTVHGYFFKNWSYAWQDGLGVAPVVLARNVDWQPSAPRNPQFTISLPGLAAALLVAGGIAVAVVWLAIRNTRRPTNVADSQQSIVFPDSEGAETVPQQLQALAEAETQE